MSFLKICLGISALLVSASLFVFSLNTAFADNGNKDTLYYSPQESGKIQMTVYRHPLYDGSGNYSKDEVRVLFWDTETGKTSGFWFGKDANGVTNYHKMTKFTLPDNPME